MNTIEELLICLEHAPTEKDAETFRKAIAKKFLDQEIYVQQLRGALGYAVPDIIPENPLIKNSIADDRNRQLEEERKMSMFFRQEAERLFGLLDDIDTAEDIFKPLADRFFNYVHKKHRARFDGPVLTDGHVLFWAFPQNPPALAAASKAIASRGEEPV